MKFKFILILLFIFSCTPHTSTLNQKKPYTAKGFAYIYNDLDYNEKIIKGKMNNQIMQLSHQNLKTGSLIKITNPINNKTLVFKNIKRIKYPDFYKIIITDPVAKKLDLNIDLPLLEITEVKKNKSFIAKKAKIYTEEKKISSKAPVASVKISNISKNKTKVSQKKNHNIYINVASFYSEKNSKFLKQRIIKEVPNLNSKSIKIKKINNKKTQVIMGPYKSINFLKNDYIKLNTFGFEEMDIFINE